ncbi:MAG: hypothetical protein AAGG53_07715 [Cyanobacteria bacterium P01_H01_bin.152]
MGGAYPIAMRQKALAAVDRGEKKRPVSRMFGISRNPLDEWLKLREATGQVSPKSYRSCRSVPKIADWVQFRRFADPRGHLPPPPMADEWSEPVSNRTMGKALKAIRFTRKKPLWLPQTGREKAASLSAATGSLSVKPDCLSR